MSLGQERKLEQPASLQEVVRFFCRHLVSLSGWYQWINSNGKPFGKKYFFSYSGFIMSIQGVWNLVTAGHILEELEQNLKDKKIQIIDCSLVDIFGLNATSNIPIPFDYNNAPKMFIYNKEDGVDFGLVIIRSHYCDLLKTNGIMPIQEKDWKNIPNDLAPKYIMLGLPQCFIRTRVIREQIVGSVAPAAIGVERIYDESLAKKHPQFIGKLSDTGYIVEDIEGMSGGPIIGFSKDWKKYWIVAVQSSWLPERRITFGCPVPFFAQIVEDLISVSDVDSCNGLEDVEE
jgi:hypothetical protein